MGYDMYLVDSDDSMDALHAEAQQNFEVACQARNAIEDKDSEDYKSAQVLVETYYNQMDSTNINYFRLNIWGMGQMREDMESLGMLAWHYQGPPEWQPEDFGLTLDEWWEDDSDEEPADERFAKARKAASEHLSWSPPDEPGLPVHKFGSNDGWVVTPLDIEGALALYERAQQDNPETVAKVRESWAQDGGDNYFDEWITFLKRAQTHGGFNVY